MKPGTLPKMNVNSTHRTFAHKELCPPQSLKGRMSTHNTNFLTTWILSFFINQSINESINSVDSRNFKKWGRSPTTTQNVGGGAKNSGGRLYDKFKLIKNTFSVYLGIFNSGLLLISGQFLLSCPIKINFKASDRI